MDTSSNTGNNRKPGSFAKGDPRINRKGRPKTFDALRALARQISHEEIKDEAGDPIVIDGHTVTVTESIMRSWAASKDPRLQMKFVEIAFGNAPVEHKVSGELEQRHSGTVKQKHSIDENQAGTIFDILASVGAIKSDVGDATDDEVHYPCAHTKTISAFAAAQH